MLRIRWLVVVLLMVTSAFASGGVYKWVDENGRVHFGDKPPEDKPVQTLDVDTQPVTADATTPLAIDEKLEKVKDGCGNLVLDQRAPARFSAQHILGKWTFYAKSRCLDKDIRPDESFRYSWEFKSPTSIEMSLGRTHSNASYKLQDNVVYMDNLARTTMVLVRREPGKLVWAHLLGSGFEAYYYVKR